MFEDSPTNYYAANGGGADWLWYLVLVIGLVFLAMVFWKRRAILSRAKLFRSLDLVFFEVLMPRETAEDKFGQESTKQNEKEIIGIAEQLYTTVYYPSPPWYKRFWTGTDSISFEISAFQKKIHFYVTCPRALVGAVERQIHAQYPKAAVEEITGYQIFRKGNFVAATELKLQKNYVYPIKTYAEQNSDPLDAITNAMSKLTGEESMSLQLTLIPAHAKWGRRPRQYASEIQQGKRPGHVIIHPAHKVARELGKTVGQGVGQLFGATDKAGNLPDQDNKPINLTPMQQEIVKKLEEKASKISWHANIRLIAASETKVMAESHLNTLLATFTQYSMPPFNGFKIRHKNVKRITKDFILRNYNRSKMILNTAELSSIWHPATKFMETPNIQWLTSRKAPPPPNLPDSGTLLGINVYRDVETPAYILDEDRMRHVYIIGRTGVGKTEIMQNMAIQDIRAGKGVCVVDPHGEFIENVLYAIPKERAEDVVLFEPADMARPFGLNMLDVKNEAQKDFVVQEMIAIFEKLFPPEVIGPMFEHNMRNVMLTLIADHNDPGTLVEIPRMFTDPAFQRIYINRVKDPTVLSFWEQEMAKTSDFHKSEMLGYLISKVGRFVENTMMRNIIGQKRNSFDFREIMDNGKILLVNLSKGKIGELNAKLLGLIIVSKLQMAALSRADQPEAERREFYLYVDEFQNFVTDSFATILSEARKYKLGLNIAHQYLSQLTAEKPGSSAQDTKVRDAVFGNVGTMVAFRIGVEDAEVMAKEFAPTFSEFDVVNIERFNAYIKLMVHNTVTRPFSIKTLKSEKFNDRETVEAIRRLSRLKYGRPREQVEADILERSQLQKISLEPKDVRGQFA